MWTGVDAARTLDPASAADEVVRALHWLRWDWRRAVLLRRGDDPFWRTLGTRLSEAGADVDRVVVDPDDPRLYYHPEELGIALAPGDLYLHHDPLMTTDDAGTCGPIRALTRAGVAVVSLEFPHGRFAGERARAAYLRALATPVNELRARAATVREWLAGAHDLTIRCGDHRLTLGSVGAALDDHTAPLTGAQVLQLPLGEVWLLPDSSDVHGRILVDGGRGRLDEVVIAGGQVINRPGEPSWRHGPLVEVGIGVNPSAPALPTALTEKATGRLHLGFGDSDLLGGAVRAPGHADLYLAAGARLTCRRTDDRPTDLADVLR
jgi:hypothetical protein